MVENYLSTIHDLPLWLRMGWLAIVGGCIGSFLNMCVVRIPQGLTIGGGSRCDSCLAPIRWYDNLPVASWFVLRGRCRNCGAGFSIRHAVVEGCIAAAFAGLYWWEVEKQSLFPPDLFPRPMLSTLYAQYLSHALLLCFLTVAALIDVDHFVIPDEVTLPGSILALTLAALLPWSLLPDWRQAEPPAQGLVAQGFLTWANEPRSHWPTEFVPPQAGRAWLWGVGCWWLYVLALLPWKWYFRRGMRWAALILWRRLFGELYSILLYGAGILGTLAISAVWYVDGDAWTGLFSSLVGLAAGVLFVWPVRLVSGVALGREALGFGDVTLAAMVGAFLGWQGVVVMCFFSVFLGLAIAVVQAVSTGDAVIPFGPALCLGAALTVVFWEHQWESWGRLFREVGGLIAFLYLFSLVLMVPLLIVSRRVREYMTPEDDEPPVEPGPASEETSAPPSESAAAPSQPPMVQEPPRDEGAPSASAQPAASTEEPPPPRP